MKDSTNPTDQYPSFSVLATYSDPEKVKEIDRYYLKLLTNLSLSERLDADEKLGQRAFLKKQWEQELTPLLHLTRIKIYEPIIPD